MRSPQRATASASPAWSAIRFGSRFQTRLNQSRNISTSAARAGSPGNSGGSGCSSSRWWRIRVESVITRSPSSSTGTSSWPLASRIGVRSAGSTSIHSTAMPLCPSASATRSTLVE